MPKRNLFFSGLVILLLGLWACEEVDKLKDGDEEDTVKVTEDNKVTVETEATVPILPLDLPVYPTEVTLDGLTPSIKKWLEGKNVPASIIPDKLLDEGISKLGKTLEEATSEILQPGALSGAFNNQIKSFEKVEVSKVGVRIVLSNSTKAMAATPTVFKLFLGEGSKTESFDETVLIPFKNEDPEITDIIIKPDGEKQTLVVDDVPHLKKLLNEFLKGGKEVSFGVGYQAVYRMADIENGADVEKESQVFGKCVAALAGVPSIPFVIDFDKEKDCPSLSELLKWHFTIHKLEFDIKVKAEVFEVPKIPNCEEYSKQEGLDMLKEACDLSAKSD